MKEKMKLALVALVSLIGLGGCASTNSLSNNPAFAANKDRIVYMRVFGVENDGSGFLSGYDGMVKNLCEQGDSRCSAYKNFQFAWGMPRNSYWAGNVKFYSMVPKAVPVKKGDIIEVRLPDANRPTYFQRVVSHETDVNPVCKWEGALTSGGVVCPSLGYHYEKDLGINGNGAGGLRPVQ